MFALTLLVLLLASINYQLNLGYVLTFLLAGSGVVSMHITHGTLRGLTLHLRPVAPAFAGEPGGARRRADRARRTRALRHRPAPARRARRRRWPGSTCPRGGQATAHVSFVPTRARPARRADAERRDALPARPVPRLDGVAAGRAAAGLSARRGDAPRAAGGAPGRRRARPSARRSDGGEIEGVRAYRRGDPLKLVAWKKAAQALETGGELVSRDTSASARQRALARLDRRAARSAPEERLSRLAAWMLAAERAGVDYGLRLPGVEIAPGDGDAQRRALPGGARAVALTHARVAWRSTLRAAPSRAGRAGSTCRARRATRCSCSP